MVLKIIVFEVKPLISVNYDKNAYGATVNILKSGPIISERTKRHLKQLNFFDINGKLA